jgi:aspartyl protease family protein
MKQIPCLMLVICIAAGILCGGCSRSGRKPSANKNGNEALTSQQRREVSENRSIAETPKLTQEKTVVKMRKTQGVYEIPTEINGLPMYFIFDTGAGLISISDSEIKLLREKGKFSNEDIVGKGNFIDANGDVTEGTIVMLKTVKIGDRTLTNIEASVVHNLKAPLLMGQSALEKFGKISINYKKEEIAFE